MSRSSISDVFTDTTYFLSVLRSALKVNQMTSSNHVIGNLNLGRLGLLEPYDRMDQTISVT